MLPVCSGPSQCSQYVVVCSLSPLDPATKLLESYNPKRLSYARKLPSALGAISRGRHSSGFGLFGGFCSRTLQCTYRFLMRSSVPTDYKNKQQAVQKLEGREDARILGHLPEFGPSGIFLFCPAFGQKHTLASQQSECVVPESSLF